MQYRIIDHVDTIRNDEYFVVERRSLLDELTFMGWTYVKCFEYNDGHNADYIKTSKDEALKNALSFVETTKASKGGVTRKVVAVL